MFGKVLFIWSRVVITIGAIVPDFKDNALQFEVVDPTVKGCSNNLKHDFTVTEGQILTVLFDSNTIISQFNCHLKVGDEVLDFSRTYSFDSENNKSRPQYRYILTVTATQAMNGDWLCPISVFTTCDDNTVNITCEATIKVVNKESATPSTTISIWIWIGLGVSIVAVVIISQTCIILHFKRKAQAVSRDRRLSTMRSDTRRQNDGVRYSLMRGRENKSRKDETGIYERIENLHPAPYQRPPLPLPADEEQIYEDGLTLQRIFAPEPPSLDTLPHKRKNRNHVDQKSPNQTEKPKVPPPIHKKPSKFVPQEEYDYTDKLDAPVALSVNASNRSLGMTQSPQPFPVNASQTSAFNPRPGERGQAPVINELNSLLKKRNFESSSGTKPLVHPKNVTATNLPPKPPVTNPSLMSNQSAVTNTSSLTRAKTPIVPPAVLQVTTEQKPRPNHLKLGSPVSTFNKPPMPSPVGKEQASDADDTDEEQWTYEELEKYPIYNI